MTPVQNVIATGILYLVAIGLGVWLSRRGRPLNKALSTLHTLAALGAVTVTMLAFGEHFLRLIYNASHMGGSTDFISIALFAAAGLSAIALIATGAALCYKTANKVGLPIHNITAVLAAACLAGAVCLSGYCFATPVVLPNGIQKVQYSIAEPDDNPLYTADADSLKARDLVRYMKHFGKVEDAETAAKVAATVHHEIYGEPTGKFIVSYNNKAGCWIVYDELPRDSLGGSGYFAIRKDTGEIIMAFHEK